MNKVVYGGREQLTLWCDAMAAFAQCDKLCFFWAHTNKDLIAWK